jgi:hypothetical protein
LLTFFATPTSTSIKTTSSTNGQTDHNHGTSGVALSSFSVGVRHDTEQKSRAAAAHYDSAPLSSPSSSSSSSPSTSLSWSSLSPSSSPNSNGNGNGTSSDGKVIGEVIYNESIFVEMVLILIEHILVHILPLLRLPSKNPNRIDARELSGTHLMNALQSFDLSLAIGMCVLSTTFV